MSKDSVDSVKIRMYRHGFGDCFLLSFFQGEERVFAMLVDCGIKHNTRSKDAPIKDVIQDLTTTLTPAAGGKPVIDVLVVTHEHWDHIAFFHPTRSPDFFSGFDIKQIWLGWTEDPTDEEAVEINSRLRGGAAALQLATSLLRQAETKDAAQFRGMAFGSGVAAARKSFNAAMNDVLGFYGVASTTSPSGIKYKKDGKISIETEVAMDHIIKLGKKGGIKYLNPGTKVDKRRLPAGVGVYVLAPPRSSLINKSNPSSGHAHETYFGVDRAGLTGFVEGVKQRSFSSNRSSAGVTDGPFGPGVGMSSARARKSDPYFKKHYFAKSEAYRKIENAWLDAAGQFALQLDGAINNTSLVLAVELEGSQKVILLTGDAQVGSWLSWHDHEWKRKHEGATETVTAEQLLNNTVVYKVGHHGSHNATVAAMGLEMMTHPELVAMIPEKEDSYNGILYQPLMDELQRRCQGRVLVSADVNYPPEVLLRERPKDLSSADWKAFKQNLTVNKLYVEYTIQS